MPDAYSEMGVSASKEDVHDAISGLPAAAFPGAFCHSVDDPQNARFVHAIHSDGAGTKANVAYLAYRDTGDTSWFGPIAQDSLVMNLDDLLCIGATGDFVVSNTIGRNASHISGAVLKEIIEGYQRVAEDLRPYGVTILLCGGETADIGDAVRVVIVDSSVYVRVAKDRVIDFSRVRPGDAIVGLASFGKAEYERAENSGIGSNGFTLARHVLLDASYRRFAETYSPQLDPDTVYHGRFRLDDPLPGTEMTIGRALLSPTRSFAPIIIRLLSLHAEDIHGLIHCTGGGQTKSLRFGQGLNFVKESLFDMPPILQLIEEEGGLDASTMLRTFNCGHRMEVFCDPAFASTVIETAASLGVAAQVVGEVRKSVDGRNRVTIVREGSAHVFE